MAMIEITKEQEMDMLIQYLSIKTGDRKINAYLAMAIARAKKVIDEQITKT